MATVTGLTASATTDLVNTAKNRSTHTGTQLAATISDLTEVIQDTVATELVAGTNVTLNYDDTAGKVTISSTASGGGGGGSSEGIMLSAHTNGGGTAAANTTAVQAWINAALTADKPAINDLGAIDIQINARINMVGDHLKLRANGLRLLQTVNTQAGARFGGEGQDIDSLRVFFPNNPTAANVEANCFEFGNCLLSNYSSLIAQNGARGLFMIQEIPANGDQASNTVFSCTFYNTRVSGYAISGIDMRTYVAGMAASTGNAWVNTYVHNNWFGSNGSPSSWPVIFRGFDESSFDQFNVEWTNPPQDVIFLQECKNMLFNSVHFEGITLTGTAALVRPYYDARLVVNNMFAKSITIADNAGQKSLFRGYSNDGNPLSIIANSVRVRSTTNTGARPFALVEVESGTTGGDLYFRNCDVDQFAGGIVVDPTGVSVIEYNRVRLQPFIGSNIAVDKIRTTDAAAVTNSTTLVTDATLQATLGLGTWLIEGMLLYTGPAAGDFKHRFNFGGNASSSKFIETAPSAAGTTAATQLPVQTYQAIPINTDTVAGCIDAVEVGLSFRGTIVVTGNGVLSIQYAQSVANATGLVVKTGSFFSYRKIS